MKKHDGYSRLKGLAAAAAIGATGFLGLFGSAARAATTLTKVTVSTAGATWNGIGSNSSFPSSSEMTTTNGDFYSQTTDAYGIADAALVTTGGETEYGDAFDNALILSGDGNLFQLPGGVVDVSGNTVLTPAPGQEIVPGVFAQIEYHFYASRPAVRGLFKLENTNSAPVTLNAVVLSDYGSDDNTTVRSTSSGDTTIDNNDYWYITDEGDTGDDPRITTTRYGSGAAVVPLNALTPSDSPPSRAVSGLRYPLTIPAGDTQRIMVFMELGVPALADAPAQAAAAEDFESMEALDAAGLISDLDAATRGTIVNYASTGGASDATPVPLFGNLGSLLLFGLLGGAGMFELRRRKNH